MKGGGAAYEFQDRDQVHRCVKAVIDTLHDEARVALYLDAIHCAVVVEPSRVVVVASTAHGFAAKEWTPQDLDLDFKRVKYSPWGAYGNSKLANILFAKALAKRLPDSVTAVSLHPGVIRTPLWRETAAAGGLVSWTTPYSLMVRAAQILCPMRRVLAVDSPTRVVRQSGGVLKEAPLLRVS